MNIDRLLVDSEEHADIQGVDKVKEIIKGHFEKNNGKITAINISLASATEQEIGQLFEFVFQNNYPGKVTFAGQSDVDLEKINKNFEALFIRNQIKNQNLSVAPSVEFSMGDVRKAKVNLIKGKKFRPGLQVQQQQQQQKQQQQQTTQQMMARRNDLVKNYKAPPKPDVVQNEAVGDERELINRFNVQPKLGQFAQTAFPNKQLDLTDIWQKLVGENAEKIQQLDRKITHVKKDAMEKIIKDYPEFSYGLIFENLPAGFYINETVDKTILCYSEEKAKKDTKNPLAITLSEEKPPVIGDTSLLILSALPANANYAQIQQALLPGSAESNLLQTRFNKLIDSATSLQEKNNLSLEILANYNPQAEKINSLLDNLAFTESNKRGLARLLLTSGPKQLQIFLEKLSKLKSEGLYGEFKKTFLDRMENYESLVTETGLNNIDALLKFDAAKLNWWHSLTEQHVNAGARSDFNELSAAFQYFVQEVKELTKIDTLPAYCPFENITHMKVTLDRALFLIKNAIDKEEQFYHLNGLDMRQEGAYYAARYEDFKLVSAEMGLSPDAALQSKLMFPDKISLVANASGVFLANKNPGGLANIFKSNAKLIPENDKKNGFHYAELRKNHSEFHRGFVIGGLQPDNNFALYEVNFPLWKGFMTYQISRDKDTIKKQARFFFYDERSKTYRESFDNEEGYTSEPIVFPSEIDPAETKRSFGYSYQYNAPGKELKLFGFVDSLRYETNKKYFLRYIGEQKFALPLDTYKKIITMVDSSTFSEHEIVDNRIKKVIIQLLTFTTTGGRISEVQDIYSEVQKLIDLIHLGEQKFGDADLLPEFILMFIEMHKTEKSAIPTIADINTMLETCYQYNKRGSIHSAATNISFLIQKQGKITYQLLNILNTRARIADKATTLITKADFIEFVDVTEQIYNSTLSPIIASKNENILNQLYIIFSLTSKLDVDKAKAIANAFDSIADAGIRDDFFAILSDINIEKSYELPSAEQLTAIIDKIKGSNFTEEDRKAEIQKIVHAALPNTAFGNEPVAQSLAGLFNIVKSFVEGDAIDGALKKLDTYGTVATVIKKTDIIKNLNALQKELEKQDSSLNLVLELLKNIEASIQGAVKKILKLPLGVGEAAVRKLIKQVAGSEDEEMIKDFLQKPSLLLFMKTPLQDYFKSALTLSSNELRTGNDDIKNYLLEKLGDLEIDKSIDQALRAYSQRFDELYDLLNILIKIKNSDETEFRRAAKIFIENKDMDVKLHKRILEILSKINLPISNTLHIVDKLIKDTNATPAKINIALSELGKFSTYQDRLDKEVMASLIKISLSHNLTKDSIFPIDELMNLKNLSESNKKLSSKETNELFTQLIMLIKHAPLNLTGDDLAKMITSSISVINKFSNEIPEIVSFINLLAKVTMPPLDPTGAYLPGNLETYKNYLAILDVTPSDRLQLKSVMDILLTVAFNDEGKVVLDSNNIKNIIEKVGLLYQQNPELLQKLADAFNKTPKSSELGLKRANTLLEQTLSILHPDMQKDEFEKISKQIDFLDQDPCGTRVNPASPFEAIDPNSIDKQFSASRVKPVISQIEDMYSKQVLPKTVQAEIARQFAYINGIGYKHPVTFKGEKKPLKDFTREQLKELSTSLVEEIRKNKDNKAIKLTLQLQLVAVMRETLFRSTGKLPYSTQIISVLQAINNSENLMMQINTGEGKGITSALLAVLQWAEGHTVELSTANRDLAKRDLHEFRDFFDSLGVKSSLIRADSPAGTYRVGYINYSNLSDMSLYHAAAKTFGENLTRNEKGEKIPTSIILDEVDYSILDDKTLFNFSINPEGGGDPHVNRYAWVYPLINDFIELPEFRNLEIKEGNVWDNKEDIRRLNRYLSEHAETQEQQIQLKNVQPKLDRWLNAACNAKQLEEGSDFVIQKETRKKDGIDREFSIAVPLINNVPQVGASFSDGVQQFIHARLMKKAATEGLSIQFPIDAEMLYVASESAKNYIDHVQKRGRVIGISGTLGTERELQEVKEKLNCKALSIPPHDKNNRQMERPQFKKADKEQISAIRNAILDIKSKKEGGKQPVLIVTENISTAKDLFNHLQSLKEKGFTVEVITGDEPEAERLAKLKESGKPNHIIITTSFLGRGTDYKPEHPDGLFVIQTYLDNERTSRQIIGRTARNGKLGKYLAIYNANKIMHKYNVDLSLLPKGEREKEISKLQRRMDEEAAVERHYIQEVDGIKNVILDQVTKWQKLVAFLYEGNPRSKEITDGLLALREEIIKSIEEKWQDILEASDEDRIYPNPYVRRNLAGQLEYQVLEEGLATYEKDVQNIWKQFKDNIIDKYVKPNVDISKEVGAPDAQVSEKDLNKLRYDYLNSLDVAEALTNRKTRLPSQPGEKQQVTTDSNIDSAIDEDAAFLFYDKNIDDQDKEKLLIQSSFYQTKVALTEFKNVISESTLSQRDKKSLLEGVEIVLKAIPQTSDQNTESLEGTLKSAMDSVLPYLEKTKNNLSDQIKVQRYTLPLLETISKARSLNLKINELNINALKETTIDNAYQNITTQLKTMLAWAEKKSWHYYLETPAAKQSALRILQKLRDLEGTDKAEALKQLYTLLHKENLTVKNHITFGFGHKDIKKTIAQTLKVVDQLSAVSTEALSLKTVRAEAKEQASSEYFITKLSELIEKENERMQKLGPKMPPQWNAIYERIKAVEREDKTPYALLEIHFLLYKAHEEATKTDAPEIYFSAINRLFKSANNFVKEAKNLEDQPASLDKFILLKQKQWNKALNVDAMKDKPKLLHLRQIDSGFRRQFELVVEVDGANDNSFYRNLDCSEITTKNPLVGEFQQKLDHLNKTKASMDKDHISNAKNLVGLQNLVNEKDNLTINYIQNTDLEEELKQELINYFQTQAKVYLASVEKTQIQEKKPEVIEEKPAEKKTGFWSTIGGLYTLASKVTQKAWESTGFSVKPVVPAVKEQPTGPTPTEKLQEDVKRFIGKKVSALTEANSAIEAKAKPLSEQQHFLEFKISKLKKQSEKTHFVRRFDSVEELLEFETTLKTEQAKIIVPQVPLVAEGEPLIVPQNNR